MLTAVRRAACWDSSRGAQLESREYSQAQLALRDQAAMEAYAATPAAARGASAVTTEGEQGPQVTAQTDVFGCHPLEPATETNTRSGCAAVGGRKLSRAERADQ